MTGRIPQAFIDEVLERTSIVSLIDSHVPLKKRGNSYLACCPFHHEKTPSFNVVADKGFYHCFGCGVNGNAISFLMDYLKQDFLDALDTLADMCGLEVPKDSRTVKEKKSPSLYQLLEDVCQFYQQQLKNHPKAIEYLRARGLNEETLSQYRVGFAPAGWNNLSDNFPGRQQALIETGMLIKNDNGNVYDRYRERVMFPILDRKGQVIAFGGRVTGEGEPKYLNSPETSLFHKSRTLYGLYQARQKSPKTLLIVEGYMDVTALAEAGIDNAVATLGTATTQDHIRLLLRYSPTLVFCFDGDKAGRAAAWRALLQCIPVSSDEYSFKYMLLPQGDDPDSLVKKEGREAFLARIDKATPLAEFLIAKLRAEVSLADSSGRSQLVNLAKEPLLDMPESTCKEIIVDKLAQLARVDKSRLEQQLAGNTPPPSVTSTATFKAPSPMRLALALLIQNPSLYQKLEKPLDLTMLTEDGSDILMELLSVLETKTNTAQILEHWRGSETGAIISRLATLTLQVPEDGQLSELEGALARLKKNALKLEIDKMLQKANQEGLNDQERHILQRLIKQGL